VEAGGNRPRREALTGCFARAEPEVRPGGEPLFLARAAFFAGLFACKLADLRDGVFRLGKNQTPTISIIKNYSTSVQISFWFAVHIGSARDIGVIAQ
jgi:hypothetical protein